MDMLNTSPYEGSLPAAQPSCGFLDGWNTQMALSQATQRHSHSRGQNGQRSGNAMRVVKPSSTNNSPRNSMIMGRRRTLINDGRASLHPNFEAAFVTPAPYNTQPSRRGSRPVSWHPGSHLIPQPQIQQPPYQMTSTPGSYGDQHDSYAAYPQLSPMMASYSADTSPTSAFSPLPLPFSGPENTAYLPTGGWDSTQRPAQPCYPTPNSTQDVTEAFPYWPSAGLSDESQGSFSDWQKYITQGSNRENTSPPTPDSFLQPKVSHPVVAEDSVPYQALAAPEEEGEILVGMGLYDPPEKLEEDPQLDNYRTTVSSLLGSQFRPQEPQGRGLKLEETWEPPKSDDGDDDAEEGEDAGPDFQEAPEHAAA